MCPRGNDSSTIGESGHLAEAARNCLLATSLPASVVEAIAEAYRILGNGKPIPVAVRSSASGSTHCAPKAFRGT